MTNTVKMRIANAKSGNSAIRQNGRTAQADGAAIFQRTVELVPTQDRTWAPMDTCVEVKTSGFLGRPQELTYFWDWGQPGGYPINLPQRVSDLWSMFDTSVLDVNQLGGRFGANIYTDPGSYTATVTVKDTDGTEVSGSYTFTVTDDIDEQLPIRHYVDPDGDFVDENGIDREAAGDRCHTDYAFIDRGRGGPSQVYLRRGKEHTSRGQSLRGAGAVIFQPFGDPSLPKPNLINGISQFGSENLGRVFVKDIDAIPPNGWDSTTASGEYVNRGISGSGFFCVWNCHSSRVRGATACISVGADGTGAGKGVEAPTSPNQHAVLIGNKMGPHFQDYAVSGGGNRTVLIGNDMGRHVLAMNGGAGGLSRRYTLEYEGKYRGINVHTPYRHYTFPLQTYGFTALNEYYSNAGWPRRPIRGEPRPAIQPARRFNTDSQPMPRQHDMYNLYEGGGGGLMSTSAGSYSMASNYEHTQERNLFLSAGENESTEIIEYRMTGFVFRDNIAIWPRFAPIGKSAVNLGMEFPIHDSFGRDPAKVHNNTFIVWGDNSTWGRESAIGDEGWSFVALNTFNGNYSENGGAFEDHDNYVYAPYVRNPLIDNLAKILDLDIEGKWPGSRYVNQWSDIDERIENGEEGLPGWGGSGYKGQMGSQPDLNTTYATTPTFEVDGVTNKTLSVAISSKASTGPNRSWVDFFGRRRPEQGAVEGAVENL